MTSTAIDFEGLSTAEKIIRLQDLWDSIAQDPEAVEVTGEQKQELDLRIAAAERDPDAGIPWNDVRDVLRKRD